jgi:hypothetical protein
MKKIFVMCMVMALVAIGSVVSFAAEVYNEGNDTVVSDRVIAQIPGFDPNKPVYACSNANGWCGVNPSLATSENMAASVMTREANGFYRAKGLAGDRFHPAQLKVKVADVKTPQDIGWAKVERIVPIRSTPWVDMSEGSPCILSKK